MITNIRRLKIKFFRKLQKKWNKYIINRAIKNGSDLDFDILMESFDPSKYEEASRITEEFVESVASFYNGYDAEEILAKYQKMLLWQKMREKANEVLEYQLDPINKNHRATKEELLDLWERMKGNL